MKKKATLTRENFRMSRLLEYFTEKELTLQTGHEPDRWPELPNEHTLEQWRQLTTPNGLEAAVARAVRAAVRAIEDDSKDDPSTEPVAPDDWPARTAAMEAAWDDLGAKLDALNARIGQATDISDALDAIDEATGLEGRAIALHASTRRDLRRLTRELAGLLDLPVPLIQPLTRPERAEAFLTACHARIAELSP